jgi:hypothetical protein
MTICPKCGIEYERTASRIKHGKRTCSSCQNAYDKGLGMKRPNDYALRKLDPTEHQKMLARTAARHAANRGKLQRQPCEICGEAKVEAHHDDYSKPLQVRWLCPPHHRDVHKASGEPL